MIVIWGAAGEVSVRLRRSRVFRCMWRQGLRDGQLSCRIQIEASETYLSLCLRRLVSLAPQSPR
jgi:hypothetical protein